MTYGYSRDDAGRFLPQYIEQGILPWDPFQRIDEEGVGQLVRDGLRAGARAARPDLHLGICGEHGGDPAARSTSSSGSGLDYVSCSPYRVPIARLAAAQASLARRAKAEAGRARHAVRLPAQRGLDHRRHAVGGRCGGVRTGAARALQRSYAPGGISSHGRFRKEYGYSEDIYHGATTRRPRRATNTVRRTPRRSEGEELSPEEAAMHIEGSHAGEESVASGDAGEYDYGREGELRHHRVLHLGSSRRTRRRTGRARRRGSRRSRPSPSSGGAGEARALRSPNAWSRARTGHRRQPKSPREGRTT